MSHPSDQTPIVPGYVYDTREPAPYGSTPTAPRRGPAWPWLLLTAAVLFAGGVGWYTYTHVIKEDSGIAACQALRDGAGKPTAKSGTPMTEAEYKQLRSQFEASRYDGIREHGTRLIDVVYQVGKLGKDPGMSALAYMGPLMEQATALQSACADQGVIVDLNLGASGAPVSAPGAAPTVASTPTCSEVFQPGKIIDEKKALAGCLDAAGGMQLIGSFTCSDGRHLFQVDASTGAKPGWGYGGAKYRASADATGDPGYGKAYAGCNG